MTEPSESNGRQSDGRFGRGNQFARGNPVARHAQKLRQLFVEAVTEQDILEIVAKLVSLAKEGDIQAANLLLTRALGKPAVSDHVSNVDELVTTAASEEIINLDDARVFVTSTQPGLSLEAAEVEAQRVLARVRMLESGVKCQR